MTSEKKLNNDNFISPYICELCNNNLCYLNTTYGFSKQGRIQDFKLGGGALKKIASSGGRRENFWCISCEKSRFYAKKSYFFQLRREARKLLGYFVWKITILRKKNYIFSNFRRGARQVCPPLDPPLVNTSEVHISYIHQKYKSTYKSCKTST